MRVWALCLAPLLLSTPAQAQPGAPREAPRTNLSGYMDFHYNKPQFEDGRLDLHRFVLLVTHPFSERLRFVGELEVEHALVEGLEDAGELEIEQAYVDFLLRREFNVRAGMMLMPIGIINERHEPATYYGVERSFVDTVIVPTTWFETGVGAHGEVGNGWRYRAFFSAPLNAARFSADEGIRGGPQKGSESNIGRAALTGRVEFSAVRGLTLGVSGWTGRSGFEFRPRFDVPVTVTEADARYGRGRLDLRGQFAYVAVSNADQLNDALARRGGVDPNIASALRGFYGEAGYRVISGARFGDVGAFVRYENFDTQFKVPPGAIRRLEFDRDALVVGASFWPDPDVAVKVDYSIVRNQSAVARAPNSFNVGLGWWF